MYNVHKNTFLRLVTTSLVGGSEQGLPLLALNIGGSRGVWANELNGAALSSSVDFLLQYTSSMVVELLPSPPSLHR